MCKKIIAVITVVCIFFSLFGCTQNRHKPTIASNQESLVKIEGEKKTAATDDPNLNILYDNLIKRKTSFQINQTSNAKINVSDFVNKLFFSALDESYAKGASGGDYLRYTYDNCNVSSVYDFSNSTYKYQMTFTVSYYTTADEEKYVDNFIKNSNICKSTDSAYTKILKIADYINSNVDYDYEHDNTYTKKYTMYGALKNNKAVCQGFSLFFYRMCKENNIPCRIVASDTHAWNLVKLGEYWYNVDLTWDDAKIKKTGKRQYFLRGSDAFDVLDEHHLESRFKTSDFVSSHPISRSDYSLSSGAEVTPIVSASDPITHIYFASLPKKTYIFNEKNICPKVKVMDERGNTVSSDKYFMDYDYNSDIGTHYVKIKYRDGTNKTEKLYYRIIPPAVKISKVSTKNKKTTVLWKKSMGSKYYQIKYAKNKNFKNASSVVLKNKNKITLKKNKKMKFVKIRSYKIVKGKKYYSKWSKIKKIP